MLLFLTAACGEKYSGEEGAQTQSSAAIIDGVMLISAEKQANKSWKYTIGLDSQLIKGSKAYPFLFSEHSGWKTESVSDANGDGIYEAVITVFNREIAFTFGGNNSSASQSKWNWADLTKSSYYSPADDALVIGLCDGKMYKKGQAPFTPPPGEVGDNHLRFKKSGSQLILYVNNNRVNGNLSKPFVMGAWNNWQIVDQTIADSSGWGSINLSIVSPVTLEFIYGGYYDLAINKAGWAWPTDGSSYYSKIDNRFIACIADNGPINISGSAIKRASIIAGACTTAEPVKLISSQKLADNRYQYKIGLRSDFINGSKAKPFIIGEHTDWGSVAISDVDSDGWYEGIFEVFNREVRFTYGGDNTGNQSQWSWATVSGSKYFSIPRNSLVIGFKDGQIYEEGEAQFAAPPGNTGDEYFRFTENQDGSLDFYFNNNKINGSIASPFFKGNWTNWTSQPQTILNNSDGWGKTTIVAGTFLRPATLDFFYGGDSKNSSIDLSGSNYYDAGTHALKVCVQ
jgi:hypothetical protein